MSDDLERDFDRLIAAEPAGDVDRVLQGATLGLARRHRRLRAAASSAVAVLVVMAIVGAVAVGNNAGSTRVVDPTTTTVASRVIAANDGSIAISLTLPARLTAGERVWAELEVRNIGARALWWQAGGGAQPVSASLSRVVENDFKKWSGLPSELASEVSPGFANGFPFVDDQHTGLSSFGRTSELVMKALAPGERLTFRVSADLRMPQGGGRLVTAWVSAATLYDKPEDYTGSEDLVRRLGQRAPVTAEAVLPVSAVPDDAAGAIAAFAGDRRLAAFVDETRVPGGAWYADLAWWHDAWELTVTPERTIDPRGQSRYRLRWRDGQIIDARRIWWDQSPADDPDGTRYAGTPADDIG